MGVESPLSKVQEAIDLLYDSCVTAQQDTKSHVWQARHQPGVTNHYPFSKRRTCAVRSDGDDNIVSHLPAILHSRMQTVGERNTRE